MNASPENSAAFTTITRQIPSGTMELSVNMSSCERILRERLPWRIWAIASFQAPGADGLPMEEEKEMIAFARQELLSVVPDDGETVFAGCMTHGGRHVVTLYSNRADVLGPPPVSRVSGTRYMWDIYSEEDQSGEFLRLKLMLTPVEQRRLKDREVLDALADADDNPVVPRPITFYGLFSSSEHAAAAAEQLARQGFRTSTASEMPGRSDLSWSLMFQRTSQTEPSVIDRLSAMAESACQNNGGAYDGWSCEPVTSRG